ncbi:MAG: histidine kinase [Oleiphilaceae bacterium]|nr:histidine kinase [Oleiphilaceae bacterium]
MTFITLLLAYIARRGLDNTRRLDPEVFWDRYCKAATPASPNRGTLLGRGVAAVLVPSLLLILLDSSLRQVSYGFLLGYGLDFVFLVVLMGMPAWRGRLEAYGDAWQSGDMQAAWHHVKGCLRERERHSATTPETLHLAFSGRFMTTVFERYFLIMFWYLVGGIGVAFLVRGVLALRDHWPQAAARPRFALVAEVLAWLPARLLAFSFGLAGDLSGWLDQSRRYFLSFTVKSEMVLMTAANSALTGFALDPIRFARLHPDEWLAFGSRSLMAVRNLLNRSLLVWICVLALLVIAGILK